MATAKTKPAKAPKLAPAPSVAAMPPAAAAVVETATVNAEEALEAVSEGAAEMKEIVRKTTERTLEQTRAAYERMKTAAEDATGAIEATFTRTSLGFTEISTKTIDAFKANADAQFELVKALMGVKTPAEALTLQNDFLKTRLEVVKEQVAGITAVAQRVATEAAEPVKSSFGKAFNVAA